MFPILHYLVNLLCPSQLIFEIKFSPLFLSLFFLFDQILCAICLIKTPKGTTKRVSCNRMWQSIWYGFLNCKTYYLVLIPLLFDNNISFSITTWIIDACIGLTSFINERIKGYWGFTFYHIHRISHISHVYPDAHKFHHYLQDTTAFVCTRRKSFFKNFVLVQILSTQLIRQPRKITFDMNGQSQIVSLFEIQPGRAHMGCRSSRRMVTAHHRIHDWLLLWRSTVNDLFCFGFFMVQQMESLT